MFQTKFKSHDTQFFFEKIMWNEKLLAEWGAVKNCRHCHHLIFIYVI